jgi:hypothetical protein
MCTHIFEVLDNNMCLSCKEKVIKAVDTMPYKRQKIGDNQGVVTSHGGSIFKFLMGLIALVSVVCTVALQNYSLLTP